VELGPDEPEPAGRPDVLTDTADVTLAGGPNRPVDASAADADLLEQPSDVSEFHQRTRGRSRVQCAAECIDPGTCAEVG
jgi:hypothetical protein